MSPGGLPPAVALVGRGRWEGGGPGTAICQAQTWKPVRPPPELCLPLGGQQVEGGGRRPSSKDGLSDSCWSSESSVAGRFLLPNALPLSQPLRAKLSLPPSLPLCLSTISPLGSLPLDFFLAAFFEMYFTHHPFKVCNSVFLSMFTESCNHHQFWNIFVTPQQNPVPISCHSPFPPPTSFSLWLPLSCSLSLDLPTLDISYMELNTVVFYG